MKDGAPDLRIRRDNINAMHLWKWMPIAPSPISCHSALELDLELHSTSVVDSVLVVLAALRL